VFTDTPELYDAIYGYFKDYEAEAARVAGWLKQVEPGATTILDVACGTGEHARWLHEAHGYSVSGLDIEPAFVELARSKLPGATFWQADMADFDLDLRFDAVVCLFSSIGYLLSLERVEAALSCFRRHLSPAGVVLVEPWISPTDWKPGMVHVHKGERNGAKVVRMSHSTVDGRISRIEFHYLIGDPRGIDHRVEGHELLLSTRDELRGAFERAGFSSIDYDPVGLIGRGMFIARA
jgi:ubiquinone/menaquinone biosynthesis C-methylase UbiE